MKQEIQQELKRIEDRHDVQILYACESGSRARGIPSGDSDYDVRFIYIHKRNWYLSIDRRRDVIELPINQLLDVSGWEFTKALRLLRKSNPSLLEWLHSDIVYQEASSAPDRLRALSKEVFLPASAIYHYLNMAKGNFREYLKHGRLNPKQYLNMLRPVLACKWIETYNEFPPLSFPMLAGELAAAGNLKEEIRLLIDRKIQGDSGNDLPRLESVLTFLEAEIAQFSESVHSYKAERADPTVKLDRLFLDILEEVWGS